MQEYEADNEESNAALSRMRNRLLDEQQETANAESNK